MTIQRKYIFIFSIILSTLTSMAQKRITQEEYISQYKTWAVAEMKKSGIPASITLAQGILESDCGNSMLAVNGNNHFGIKCHDWTGETIFHDDDKNQECFRKYNSASESFSDHTYFLVSKSRYQILFTLKPTDYKAWAIGLKNAGYATDPNYATRLIDIIERLELYQYDSDTKEKESDSPVEITKVEEKPQQEITPAKKTPTIRNHSLNFEIDPLGKHKTAYNNGVRYIELRAGDTAERIAVEFHILVSDLWKYNDMTGDEKLSSIKYLYLGTKRNRAHRDCPTHVVKSGETLWSISQKYGIKLNRLARRNNIDTTENLKTGTIISLR